MPSNSAVNIIFAKQVIVKRAKIKALNNSYMLLYHQQIEATDIKWLSYLKPFMSAYICHSNSNKIITYDIGWQRANKYWMY